MLKTLKQNLNNHFKLERPVPRRDAILEHAAILVLVCGARDCLELLLTLRSNSVSRHRGEVAFPGGMWQEGDADLLVTALREANEEIGIHVNSIELIATLPSASPMRNHLTVIPFVAYMANEQNLIAQPSEISEIFRVPFTYLMDQRNYLYFEKSFEGQNYRLPYLKYNDYEIWGFTLMVLVDLLNVGMAAEIDLSYPF